MSNVTYDEFPDLEKEMASLCCAAIRWGGSAISTTEYEQSKQRFRDTINLALSQIGKAKEDK